MYSGLTGAQLPADVFIGSTFYQRLKQMTEDKVNCRGARGARDPVTRQPARGRARGGGLRIGEMELRALEAHGVMAALSEGSMARSDACAAWTDGAGAACVFDEAGDRFLPAAEPECDKRFRRRLLPRAFTVLTHELAGMGIDVRLGDVRPETEPPEP
jgi:DNA-directed RNA polymerase beta subunit